MAEELLEQEEKPRSNRLRRPTAHKLLRSNKNLKCARRTASGAWVRQTVDYVDYVGDVGDVGDVGQHPSIAISPVTNELL